MKTGPLARNALFETIFSPMIYRFQCFLPLWDPNKLIFADNQISDIEALDLKSNSGSLVTLILAGNSLTAIPEGVFWNLKMLTDLDLSRNNINGASEVDESQFVIE